MYKVYIIGYTMELVSVMPSAKHVVHYLSITFRLIHNFVLISSSTSNIKNCFRYSAEVLNCQCKTKQLYINRYCYEKLNYVQAPTLSLFWSSKMSKNVFLLRSNNNRKANGRSLVVWTLKTRSLLFKVGGIWLIQQDITSLGNVIL